ncbi:MAG: hypothetical protein NC548_36045 [Lachnospiraceae bacterium]|nr:hypothetical protein [Lachnospiraceae bacterium]
MIAKDKIQHICVCAAVAYTLCEAMCLIGSNSLQSSTAGAVCAMTAGITKEYADKAHGCVWDWKDIIADSIGTAIGVGLFNLRLWLIG